MRAATWDLAYVSSCAGGGMGVPYLTLDMAPGSVVLVQIASWELPLLT